MGMRAKLGALRGLHTALPFLPMPRALSPLYPVALKPRICEEQDSELKD